MNNLTEKTLGVEDIYQGQVVNLKVKEVELPDGQISTREVVEHNGGAVVIPYHQGQVILIKQFRKAAEEVLYELPAGMLEEDEEPSNCAQRELEEETGYRAASLEKVSQFYTSPGFTSEELHLYLATDLTEYEQQMDEHEFVEVEEIPIEKIEKKLASGQFKDAKTIIGLQYLLQNYKKSK